MRKLLLFALLIAGFAFNQATAQSLSLLNENDEVIAPDGSIGISGLPSDAEIVAYVKVKNNSSSQQSVLMKKVMVDTLPGTVNSFCYGTNCFPPSVYVSPEFVDIPAGGVDNSFSGHYEPWNVIGTSIVRYTFWLRDNPNDSVSVRAYFMAFPTGVQEKGTSLTSVYPNPADARVTVSYSATGNAVISVKDILGSQKFTTPISGSGKINISTADLPNGIYFCTIEESGRTVATKKIIVRH